jgi:hypothetical protein
VFVCELLGAGAARSSVTGDNRGSAETLSDDFKKFYARLGAAVDPDMTMQ